MPNVTGHLPRAERTQTRGDFIRDVAEGISLAPMSIRLTPHILSVINWSDPLDDPVRRQLIPMKSSLLEDHPRLKLDSLNECNDSPVPGIVHRYPDKALFLGELYCYSIPSVIRLIPHILPPSDFSVPRVLSLLHPIIFCWCRDKLCQEETLFTNP